MQTLLLLLSTPDKLYVPNAYRNVPQDSLLVLDVVSLSPLEALPVLSLWRKRGPLARAAWDLAKPAICGHRLLSRALAHSRPDIFAFVGRTAFAMVQANAPANWLDNAVTGTWPAPIGGKFAQDVLLCKQIGQIFFERVTKNVFIALHNNVGLRCTYSDSLVLLLLLFFGPPAYHKKVPFYAPKQLHEAGKAAWLSQK